MDLSNYFLNEEQQNLRLSICNSCENKIELTNTCGKCMCYLPWKVRMAPASCPENKWAHVTINNVVN